MHQHRPGRDGALLSLLPVGIAQTIASIDNGMWYARSAEFLQQDYIQVLKWMRAIGDSLFATGILSLGYFVLGLKTGWSVRKPTNTPKSTLRRELIREPAPANVN